MKTVNFSVFFLAARHVLLAGCLLVIVQAAWAQPKPVNTNTVAYLGQHVLQPSRIITYKTVDRQSLRLHIFEPAGFKSQDCRPSFLVVHGGGWVGGDAQSFYPFADHFAQEGWVGISMEYRLVKKQDSSVTVFDCVKDARSAVRYVRSHARELGIDPNKIVVGGGSAGGHLGACTALCQGIDEKGEDISVSCMPDALVLFWPALDTSKDGYGNAICGEHWKEISPLHLVRPGMPPTIVFHGTADRIVPFKGAEAFHDAMFAAGNRCELVVREGGGHGYLMWNLRLFNEQIRQADQFLASLRYPMK